MIYVKKTNILTQAWLTILFLRNPVYELYYVLSTLKRMRTAARKAVSNPMQVEGMQQQPQTIITSASPPAQQVTVIPAARAANVVQVYGRLGYLDPAKSPRLGRMPLEATGLGNCGLAGCHRP